MLLSQAIESNLQTRWRDASNPLNEVQRVTAVMDHIGDLPVSGVTPDLIDRALDLEGVHHPATRNRYKSAIRACGVKVHFEPIPASEERVLTSTELERLDGYVRDNPSPRHQAVYAILRDTGSRGLVELGRIREGDIDWTEGHPSVILRSRKGSREERKVPLSDTAYRALAWMAHDGFHWPTRGSWRNYWLKVTFDGIKPYHLRHTFCTRLLDEGVPVPVVQRIMGHSTMDMTMRYFHQRPAAVEQARQALNGYLRSPESPPRGSLCSS